MLTPIAFRSACVRCNAAHKEQHWGRLPSCSSPTRKSRTQKCRVLDGVISRRSDPKVEFSDTLGNAILSLKTRRNYVSEHVRKLDFGVRTARNHPYGIFNPVPVQQLTETHDVAPVRTGNVFSLGAREGAGRDGAAPRPSPPRPFPRRKSIGQDHSWSTVSLSRRYKRAAERS